MGDIFNSYGNDLLNNANDLDREKGITDEAILQKEKAVKAWRRRVAKINSAMLRTMENPPTDYDIRKLDQVEHWFKKD